MNLVEKILRKQTMELFNDDWYFKTSELILGIKEKQFGYVYFVRNGTSGLVKIGKASNLSNRLSGFRTSFNNGVLLCGFFYCENYSELERNIHLEFLNKRKNGEWFDLESSSFSSKNGFIPVEKYFIKTSSVLDGECFGFESVNSAFGVENYYSDFYNYCLLLNKNVSILKNDFYSKILKLNKNYANLSRKRVNIVLKKWCLENGISYSDYNSNGKTFFILN